LDREITLRDYGRVLWSGRWIIVATTVGAILVGIIISVATQTKYTSTSIVYLGQATTPAGIPVATPLTTPVTAPKVLHSDTFVKAVADHAGVSFNRVKDGVTFRVDRVPGAAAGNQPTVATITYVDRSRAVSRRVADDYADAVYGRVNLDYARNVRTYDQSIAQALKRQTQLQGEIDRFRRGLPGSQVELFSAQQELNNLQENLFNNQLARAKAIQIEAPQVISQAESPSSSASTGRRLRTIVLSGIIGFIVGVIVVFIWRGSPAGRAAT
jgi:uncharacterized protein involved in exopolysaccharide biosynthesis